MKPVLQTQFVATHGKGNCVQAAIASILDLSLEDVPAFRDLPAYDFDTAIDKFLHSRGLYRITVEFTGSFESGDAFFKHSVWCPEGDCHLPGPPCLVFGKSPRGNYGHAVVGRMFGAKFELLHDPHPDATGIQGDPRSIHWIVKL